MWLDLLQPNQELRFAEDPDALNDVVRRSRPEWVVIDEVQKVPKLLDVVHSLIESTPTKFALTGSSARKLKRGAGNLLAGRAFVYHLFPLTAAELGSGFSLMSVLQWGSLPKVVALPSEEEKGLFLEAYVETYLKEEIFQEQLTRKIVPFRKFLRVAAQCNGTVLNFSQIAHDISIDSNTVKTYFDILEDTLLGFYLPATDRSFRKQQLRSPKFYLFDVGVTRAIQGLACYPLRSSQELGPLFEHWIISEIHRLNSYTRRNYQMSYLRTKGGLEVDLVLEHPQGETILIEIKSSPVVRDVQLTSLIAFKKELSDVRCLCICREEQGRLVEGVEVLPWREAFGELGFG